MPKDQPAILPVTQKELVFKGRIWDVVRETFGYGSNQLTREFVEHPGAVAVVALNEKLELLMIRQYRHPVRGYLWELPAGLLDIANESRIDAARRELFEETGYEAGKLEVLIDFYTTPGGNSEQITVFLATELVEVGHELDLEGEEADMILEWVPLAEALGSVLRSEIKSPTAAVGIMAAANKLGVVAN